MPQQAPVPIVCFFQNMAKVQVNNVVVLDNPSPFYNPFQFEITFECIEDLSEGESGARPSPGCQLRAADVESFPGLASRGRPCSAPGGLRAPGLALRRET